MELDNFIIEHTNFLQNIFGNLIIIRYINNDEIVYNTSHREIIYSIRDFIDKDKKYTQLQKKYKLYFLKCNINKLIQNYHNILNYHDNYFTNIIDVIKLKIKQLNNIQNIENLCIDNLNLKSYLEVRGNYIN